ncbi:adenylyl-sulfate kinase [Candidatus Marinimicrobia bacterium]|nr:adenylyl-sulfate kinase [Candidatus Neomarinimicrobiota bacterium]MDC1000292.1 adenylyl-sulfate kinase [Candidatus Neomarinimicrobiota bacterium]
MDKKIDVVWHSTTINNHNRNKLLNQTPFIIWFTGLSASGKSTLANIVEQKLFQMNYNTYLLDGDNVRHGLNKDLGFSEESRVENIRRIGEVSKLFLDSGIIVLTAFISPFKSDRNLARSLVKKEQFIEVFVDASLETCEKRDPKGMYLKARSGEISHFTGISSPYETPQNPELHIVNNQITLEDASNQIIEYLVEKKHITKKD